MKNKAYIALLLIIKEISMLIKYIIIIFPVLFILSCNKPIEKKNAHTVERKKSVIKIDTLQFIGDNPEKVGYVPDAETAIAMAEAVWLPIYGKKFCELKPYIAKLQKKNIWYVHTTLPKGYEGGRLDIFINKRDGKIIKIYGTK